MATVWAAINDPTVGTFRESTTTGWSHLFYFDTLSDLLIKMKQNRLRGKVDILGIVAHGDAGGLVNLGSPLTPETIDEFRNPLHTLRWYLKPQATVAFYSCVAAIGEGGSKLLAEVSRLLPGRYIVGFTVWGIGSTIMGFPGMMSYSFQPRGPSMGALNPSIPHTKIALNGEIVRWPDGEGP